MSLDGESDLEHADLTHLRLQEMTPSQRAELRRRYDLFVRHFGGTGAAAPKLPERKQRVTKWVPGAKPK